MGILPVSNETGKMPIPQEIKISESEKELNTALAKLVVAELVLIC